MAAGVAAAGVDVDKRDVRSGWTPLMAAASKGFKEAVEALLAAGADASVVAGGGRSAVSEAERAGHAEVALMLRLAGRFGVPEESKADRL